MDTKPQMSQVPPAPYQGAPPVWTVSDPEMPLRVGGGRPGGGVGKRFVKALVAGGAVFALLHLVTHTVVRVGRGRWSFAAHEISGPTHQDGDVVSCVEGTDWIADADAPPEQLPHGEGWEVSTAFHLPVDAAEHYFIARGAHSFGKIDIREGEHDEVHVQVKAAYHHDEAMKEARVCSLERDGKHGVGIFTPEHHDHGHDNWKHQIRWAVAVSIPSGTDIAALRTAMPIFPHTVDGRGVTFDKLSLSTTNARISLDAILAQTVGAHTTNAPIDAVISAKDTTLRASNGRVSGTYNVSDTLDVHTTNAPIDSTVNATRATLVTSNGRISGAYNVSNTLILRTANAPIDTSVQLIHDGSSASTSATLESSNGRLAAEFVLAATTPSTWGGTFKVRAHTSNSPLSVVIKDSPADSALALNARTSLGRATAALHRAFEGRFAAHTSLGRVALSTPHVDDPRGAGRERIVDGITWDRGRTSVSGLVHWDDEEAAKRGSVVLATTNAPIELIV